MAKTNKTTKGSRVAITHEGGRGISPTAQKELRKLLSTLMLFENTFYEDKDALAARVGEACKGVSMGFLISEILRSKNEMHLRHAPLFAAVFLTKLHRGSPVGDCITEIIQRVDDITEIVSLYWKINGANAPLSKQMKRGIANSFEKFDEYQFAKYNRDTEVKLRDVIFLVHPEPSLSSSDGVAVPAISKKNYRRGKVARHSDSLLTKIVDNRLQTPDTWEVAISSIPKSDKKKRKAEWERLLSENRLGALALIRNLRNMDEDNVSPHLIRAALTKCKARKILPYQLLAAAKFAPHYTREIEDIMLRGMEGFARLYGETIAIVDVSGSMEDQLSRKSQMTRVDAAAGLAIMLSELSERCRVFTFSNRDVEVPRHRGFGLADAIRRSQPHYGTYLRKSLSSILPKVSDANRVVVITDEQAHDGNMPFKSIRNKYVVNVAPYKVGLNLYDEWIGIDGFSTAIAEWIAVEEQERLWFNEARH